MIERVKGYKTIILITFLGVALRLIDIARPFSGLYKWNEGHYAVTALNYFRYGLLLPVNEYGVDLTTTPFYTWMVYLSFRIFGPFEWAARLPGLFFAAASIVLVYFITEELYNRRAATIAAFVAASAPGIVYYSRNVQLESPFTAFSLAALLFLLYYRKNGEHRFFLSSALSLSLAVFTKYVAILTLPALLWIWFEKEGRKDGKTENRRLITYLALPLLPAGIWAGLALIISPGLTTWYVSKPEAPWNAATMLFALYSALANYIPQDMGSHYYYPFLIVLPLLLTKMRRHAVMLIYTASWLTLIIAFPTFYLNNSYYHYPMLYGIAVLLGAAVAEVETTLAGREKTRVKSALALVAVIMLVLSVHSYNTVFRSYYTDFSETTEPTPFYSARLVAAQNTGKDFVVTDLPMSMFYLGGDPAQVKLAYTTQGLITATKSERYTYVVPYYMGNYTLKSVLEEHGYTQIAPRAWKKK